MRIQSPPQRLLSLRKRRESQLMRRCSLFTFSLLILLSMVSSGVFGSDQKDETSNPPNIVFILADDLGWSDTTLHGTTKLYRTPNIQRLAQRGMTFRRAYAASPLCSPTRASILTGQSPARHGITAPVCHLPEARLQAATRERRPLTFMQPFLIPRLAFIPITILWLRRSVTPDMRPAISESGIWAPNPIRHCNMDSTWTYPTGPVRGRQEVM